MVIIATGFVPCSRGADSGLSDLVPSGVSESIFWIGWLLIHGARSALRHQPFTVAELAGLGQDGEGLARERDAVREARLRPVGRHSPKSLLEVHLVPGCAQANLTQTRGGENLTNSSASLGEGQALDSQSEVSTEGTSEYGRRRGRIGFDRGGRRESSDIFLVSYVLFTLGTGVDHAVPRTGFRIRRRRTSRLEAASH